MGVIAEEAVKIRADTSGFHGDVTRGVMGSIGKVAGMAAAALGGIAIGKALFVDPIKQAGEFQKSLSVLQATSNATDAEMKKISATAMKLGSDVKLPAVSASDAANAMLELAKGGFTAQQAMDAARGTLLLSTAAEIDGAEAARLVADSLHAFGLKASEAGSVVDDFAGAANASTASMSEVAQALQQSGQGFHQLGIPIGDATTAIAAMANAGIKGSDAGTSLKTMLQRLHPETTKAKAAFKAMNIDVFDQHGKFIGLEKTIAQFAPKLKGMTQEQRQHALATIFGSDASRAASIVLGMSAKKFDELRDKVTKAGQAQKLADAQTSGFKGAMSALRSTIETVQLQIGLKMLPVLTTLVRFLSANLPAAVSAIGKVFGIFADAIRSVADWLGIFQGHAQSSTGPMALMSQSVNTAKTRFDEIVASVQAAVAVVSRFLSWVSDNVGNLRQFAVALGLGAGAFVILTAAVRAYTIVQAALNAVMLANPITIVIVAIAALVVGLTLLYQRSATARAIMDAAWAGIKAGAAAAFGFITNTVIPNAIAAWNRFGPAVVSALSSAAATIRAVVQTISTIVTVIVDQIQAHWKQVWSVFGPIVVAYLQVVKTAVQTALAVVSGVIKVFDALLRGDWGDAWNALKGIATTALHGVVSIVGSILRGLAGTAKALAGAIGAAIAAGIKTAPGKLAGLAGDLAGKIASVASQAAGSAFSYMRGVGFAIADGVISGIGNLGARIASAVGQAAKKAASTSLIDIIASSPSRLYADVVGKAIGDGVIVGVQESLAKLGTTTGITLAHVASSLRNITAQLAKDIAGVSKEAADKLIATANDKRKAVGDAFGKWAENAKARFDAGIASLITSVDAQFAKAQARIEAWKAKATPTEALLAAAQARAALAAVDLAVGAAEKSIADLKVKQAADWAALMATQAANMATLRAAYQESADSALLTGNTFSKNFASLSGDPIAMSLINAQKKFDATKVLFDQGLVSQAEFIAAADALDAAKLKASEDSNATTLLDQYNTWQAAKKQQADAGAAITTQQAADLTAQKQLHDSAGAERMAAADALHNALLARTQYAAEQQAAAERVARDAAANEMNAGLVARHDRILLHLNNVQHAWDLHFNELARMGTAGGQNLTQNLANALRNGIPTVAGAAAAVAQTIAQYLKVRSPTEKGPMSDLHEWWRNLAPTLVRSLDDASVKRALTNATTPDGGSIGTNPKTDRSGFHASKVEWYLSKIHEELRQKPGAKPAPVEVHVVGGVGIDAAVYRSRR